MWIRIVSVLARLGLAAVWLTSGWIKATDPNTTELAVRAYQILPESLVHPVALGLPALELALGLLLLIGLGTRVAATISGVVLLGLIAAIASSWARGLSIDCGCFGGGGAVAGVDGWDYASEIARDLGFFALAVWLMFFPHAPWSLGPRSRPRVLATDDPEVGGSADPQALAHSAELDPIADEGREN
ncbi:DoxX family membrane protein [Rhodococcus sp. D2-41]|uniref:DoxX family membrane protein n=1 Tax=Speluncibacter jeojiensis TaxID=2710754 RepID=A0A9X4LXI5_9ACTN|nr:MauE/DoxX family redox-associated membrane protein [Rhodococcus sp. D2-41]MDG3008684.1 DoxX family membrane protein [Rhodococcus sp. D2-41]MDG3013109.1 DoxX family membrane protein [Corynebacteriales bacterium D3-21]